MVNNEDSGEGDSEDEGLEVVESLEALEEEGVVLTGEAKRQSMKVGVHGQATPLSVVHACVPVI